MGTYLDPFTFRKDIKFSLEGNKDPLTNKSEVESLEELAKFKNSTVSKTVRDIVLESLAKNRYLLSPNPTIEEFIQQDGTAKHYNEPTLADYPSIHQEFIQNTDLPLDELLRRANTCLSISKLYDNAYEFKKENEFDKVRKAELDRRLKEKLSPHLKNEELGMYRE